MTVELCGLFLDVTISIMAWFHTSGASSSVVEVERTDESVLLEGLHLLGGQS